jgi:integration host factor subunit beta
MTKSELVRKLADANPHLHLSAADVIVTTIFDEIVAALARGDRVELRGFGAFAVKQRSARIGRNPGTGHNVQIARETFPVLQDWQANAEPPQSGKADRWLGGARAG